MLRSITKASCNSLVFHLFSCVCVIDLRLGDELNFAAPFAFLQQLDFLDMIRNSGPTGMVVMGILICFSVFSWTVIFAKWQTFRGARRSNTRFLRAFRKAPGLEAVMVASEQYRPAPLVAVFDFGYQEVSRQVKARGNIANREAISRSLQLGVNEQMSRLEHNLDKLATIASVSPFIGLLGTVIGIIRAFNGLGTAGSTSLTAVGPGIADALIATAVGLFAAIPAAIFYNHLDRKSVV